MKNVVSRNSVRKSLSVKQQSYDAWRQVAEIWLTSCPEDLMPREIRQTVLFELLQELLSKVRDYSSYTVDSLIFVGYQFHGIRGYRGTMNLNVQRIANFLKEHMQTLPKQRNKISMEMQVFFNPRKLVPTK